MYFRRRKATIDQPPVDHFLQHAGASAGAVLFIAGSHIRRTHDATGSSVIGPAFAHPSAPMKGGTQDAGIIGESQAGSAGPHAPPPVVSDYEQIRVARVRDPVDARIH